MKKMTLLTAILAVISIGATSITRADTFTVKIRPGNPGTSVQLKTKNIQNPYPGNGGICVMLVHGLGHKGDSMDNMANALFAHPPAGIRVKKVIELNLPGRGGSGLPTGDPSVKFGDLNVDDYAECLIGALKHHKNDNTPPTALAGHSMGGLIIMDSQEHLLQGGKRLRTAYNIEFAIILASSSPAEVPDPFLEAGTGLFLLSLFTVPDDTRGQIVTIPTSGDPNGFDFTGFFFRNLVGELAPGTPSDAVIDASIKADESYAASLQTVGTADLRPSVRANAFSPSKGTRLFVLVGDNDQFNDPAQHIALYEHLTGDTSHADYGVISDEFAVHDQYITNPGLIIDTFDAVVGP